MKIFLIDHWADILTVIVFAAFAILLALRGKKKIVAQMLYFLVTEAERVYGSGTGNVKLAYVVEKAYKALPTVIRIFLTYDRLKELIESALSKAKESWKREGEIIPVG